MAEITAPQLPSNTSANQAYAPISTLAAVALAVAILSGVVILFLAVLAYAGKKSLIEVRLLVLPALAVVLAFVARRRIRGSEGTQTGETYANAAWLIAVVVGLGYVAYLAAIDFAVSNDAKREFTRFTDRLAKADPDNPRDPEFYGAFYQMLAPGARTIVGPEANVPAIEKGYKEALAAFRGTDLVRVCRRNPGEVQFVITGVPSWNQDTKQIDCALAATLTTPEGEHSILTPMRAEIADAKQRQWTINPGPSGFFINQKLTPYGWALEMLETAGRSFSLELFEVLRQPALNPLAGQAFVEAGRTPKGTLAAFETLMRTLEPRGALVGPAAAVNIFPDPPGLRERVLREVFAKPDGPAAGADLERFRFTWATPGRIVAAGTAIKTNTNTHPVARFKNGALEMTVPCELMLAYDGPNTPTAKGTLVLRLEPEAEAAVVGELTRLRAQAADAERTQRPPAEVQPLAKQSAWRVVRIVSDLENVQRAPQQGDRPPGGPGG